MEDPVRLAVVIAAVIVFALVVPAVFYTYMTRRKVAWRRKINVGWRRHANEAELTRAACGETRRGQISR